MNVLVKYQRKVIRDTAFHIVPFEIHLVIFFQSAMVDSEIQPLGDATDRK
jgi:hypothetical protein